MAVVDHDDGYLLDETEERVELQPGRPSLR
jgi:hypothetical protein